MAKIIWIADVLRKAGCKVYEMPGWQNSETRAGFSQQGIVCHHTATGPNWSDEKVRDLLRKGRSDLKGPLSQLGLTRNGTFDIIAAGRANHNGYGEWGNDSIGIEAYNDGKGEVWPKAQMDAYAKGCAALCKHLGFKTSKVKGHKETDPGRKIDPTFNMNQFRISVDKYMLPTPPKPTPPEPKPPVPSLREDEMFTLFYVDEAKKYYSMTPWSVSELDVLEGYAIDANSTSIAAVRVPTVAAWNKIKKNAPA